MVRPPSNILDINWHRIPSESLCCLNKGSLFRITKVYLLNSASLFARWQQDGWTISFNANGGNCGTQTIIIQKGTAVGTLPIATKTNYTFAGWYIGSEDGTPLTANTVPSSDLTVCAKWIQSFSQAFNYTGNIQTFTAPYSGTYSLEVYGAQGGSAGSFAGGQGGYSYGTVALNKGDILYICVGGAGSTSTDSVGGGYNGGGSALGNKYNASPAGSGGGATHIAAITGTLTNIGRTNLNKIYIIAGGGGGAFKCNNSSAWGGNGGAGGGENGGYSSYGWDNSTDLDDNKRSGPFAGGTQTSGYAFGLGGGNTGYYAGGGGGLYGGISICRSSGSGGSGYIGGVNNGSMISGVRSGNGYAEISYISFN